MRNASELDQLSSASIKDIEVITSPGAQYDASVNSVIRIKTVKPVGEGFGFDSRTVLGVAHYIYGLEELNFNYRKDGFDLFGMVEYDNNRDRQSNTMIQDTYAGSLIHQSTDAKRYNQSSLYAGKLGMNYIFNDSHSLGFIYDFSFRPTTTRNDSYTSLSVDRILENELTTADTTDFYSRQHLVSGYYNGRWGEWQLDVNADAMWSDQDKDQQVNEMATTADNRIFRRPTMLTAVCLLPRRLCRDLYGKAVCRLVRNGALSGVRICTQAGNPSSTTATRRYRRTTEPDSSNLCRLSEK